MSMLRSTQPTLRYILLITAMMVLPSACSGIKESSLNSEPADTEATTQEFIFKDSLSYLVAKSGEGPGADLFRQQCAACHVGDNNTKSPSTAHLGAMSPRALLSALDSGKMQQQGSQLSQTEKMELVTWITGVSPEGNVIPQEAWCEDKTGQAPLAVHSSGWAGDLAALGYRSAEQAGMTAKDVPKLRLKWAFAIPGATEMRSRPAAVGDLLIFGSQFGTVYALDRESGCIRWTYEANVAVRGAITIRALTDNKAIAYFADMRGKVHALDVTSGIPLWTRNAGADYLSSVTGTVAFHDGILIVPFSTMEIISSADTSYECCKRSGEVVALDADTGNILWRHRVVAETARKVGKNSAGTDIYGPSGAPVWSSPTIDPQRRLVYVGTGENYTAPATLTSDAILALHLDTGALAWSYQATAGDIYNMDCFDPDDGANCPDAGPDVDFGMAPMIVTRQEGKQMLVVGQKSGHVHALDPDDKGKVLWVSRVGRGSALGGIHWGMAADTNYVYAPLFDLPATVVVDIQPIMASSPGVVALDLNNGEIVWRHNNPGPVCEEKDATCLTANSAAPTVIPGAVFSGSNDGIIRALSTSSGDVIWEFPTDRSFDAINGVEAHGGAVDGPGSLIVDGTLFVLSGYSTNYNNPGNVLLAFE